LFASEKLSVAALIVPKSNCTDSTLVISSAASEKRIKLIHIQMVKVHCLSKSNTLKQRSLK
jgi:hypothetical protein